MAHRELRRYRKKGATGTTRMLLDALEHEGIRGRTFLDIGGGVGAIQHELLAAGAASGTSADASPAYLAAARSEAAARGHVDRMTYHEGDFVHIAAELPEADVVTLDRVLCCYHDMPALVDASASRAQRLYGVVIPREERALVRMGLAFINFMQRLRRRPFRVFGHSRAALEERLASFGYQRVFRGTSFAWQVLVFTRA
jgi:magnesium-protoporphyrin O-methyltransferase